MIVGVGITGLVLIAFVALVNLAVAKSEWSDGSALWLPTLVCAGVIGLGRGVALINARIATNERWWRLWTLMWRAIGWVVLVALGLLVVVAILIVLLYVAVILLTIAMLTGVVKIAARR